MGQGIRWVCGVRGIGLLWGSIQELISQHPSSPWQRGAGTRSYSQPPPYPVCLFAVVSADRFGCVVRVGLGVDCRALGKITPIMDTTPKRCHHFSCAKVRTNLLYITNKAMYTILQVRPEHVHHFGVQRFLPNKLFEFCVYFRTELKITFKCRYINSLQNLMYCWHVKLTMSITNSFDNKSLTLVTFQQFVP
jgi:hypothetical protein